MDTAALARLPETLEICARDLSGSPCRGVIFRATPDDVYCPKCGGKEPGVRYVRGARAPRHPAAEGESSGTRT